MAGDGGRQAGGGFKLAFGNVSELFQQPPRLLCVMFRNKNRQFLLIEWDG